MSPPSTSIIATANRIFGVTRTRFQESASAPGVFISNLGKVYYYKTKQESRFGFVVYYLSRNGEPPKNATQNSINITDQNLPAIPFLGLENGGFFDHKSNNPNHRVSQAKYISPDIFTNTLDNSNPNKAYYAKWDNSDWISNDGLKFTKSAANDKDTIRYVVFDNVFYLFNDKGAYKNKNENPAQISLRTNPNFNETFPLDGINYLFLTEKEIALSKDNRETSSCSVVLSKQIPNALPEWFYDSGGIFDANTKTIKRIQILSYGFKGSSR